MKFILDKAKSLVSKKIVGGIAGAVVLEGHPWQQALIICVTILAQAYVDSRK